jgi:uncharacterized protein YdeI (YjbR/CyaY-like superfamily)
MEYKEFTESKALGKWLKSNHKTASELWIRIFKKTSGHQSVTWNDCVIEAIAWGWIDGQKKSLDDRSYLQRLSPRRAKSNWSKKNKSHAERLISEGRMQPSGLFHIQEAKKDGRWDAAYEGSANMKIPQDFLDTLKSHKKALAFFKTLDRKNLFFIYLQLTTPKKPETRARRMEKIINQLSKSVRPS